MYLQIAITLILLCSIVGLLAWYFMGKKALLHIHNQKISSLEQAISQNHFQINFRNSNLNNYDFLKFNLNEALVVQPEIKP